MFLHNINYNKFNIQRGDTLLDPKHLDENPLMRLYLTHRTLSSGLVMQIRR